MRKDEYESRIIELNEKH